MGRCILISYPETLYIIDLIDPTVCPVQHSNIEHAEEMIAQASKGELLAKNSH